MYFTKSKRIVIINDDEDITNLLELFLEYDGYIVDAFTDPIDVLYSFRKLPLILFYLI
jgi:DNA-binding response OmpR family regulator